MQEQQKDDKTRVIGEIRRQNRILNLLISVVILTLFAGIIAYLHHSISFLNNLLEDLTLSLAVAAVIIFALSGLSVAIRLSRSTLRIIEDYHARLDKILGITKDLREEIYGDILLEKIMDYSLEITESQAGSLLLVDDQGNLVFRLVRGDKSAELPGKVLEKGKGVMGWTAEHGQAVRIEDASGDKRFNPAFDAMTGFKTSSMLCVPMKTRSGVMGVLALLNKKGGHSYRARDEEIITYLAEQAAISIIRTKFMEDQRNYEIHLTEILLGAIDFQIPEKRGHSHRVARYSNVIAKRLDMTEDEKKRLYVASLLHDVGFLKIQYDENFKKEEFIKHPVIGYEMIKPINFYSHVAPLILHHHERYDGHGYPHGLLGEAIPLESRIIGIAEAFDAMLSATSYKVPVSYEEAVAELRRRAGTQFDAELVEIFLESVTPEMTRQLL